MGKILKNASGRDKTRIVTIILCVALMLYGVYQPVSTSFGSCVPVDADGHAIKNMIGKKFYLDNVFLIVGGFGLAVVLGLVQIIKAIKGGGNGAGGN